MKRIIVSTIVCALMAFVFAGCARVVSEDVTEVTAEVIEMEYKRSYTTYIPLRVGKTTVMSPQYHSAKHYVTIRFEDITETFDDEELYDRVKEGDQITAYFYRGYDKAGELVRTKLKLEKE